MQGNAVVKKIGTKRIVAFVPDDGDVVQGNAVVPNVSSCKMKIRTKRIVAFVPDDGDVVQGNAVVPYVSSYKRTFRTNRIDEPKSCRAMWLCLTARSCRATWWLMRI